MFFICTGVGLAGALAFLVLGSGVEQEWARDTNMNAEFDVYTIDERKQSIDEPHATEEEKECQIGNDRIDGINSVHENRNGHVNAGFDEQINEIIEHVKLSSSFRGQSRDLNVPIRTCEETCREMTREQIESDIELEQRAASNGLSKIGAHNQINPNVLQDKHEGLKLNAMKTGTSENGKETSTFLQRTKHSRENLRLYLPNHIEHVPTDSKASGESFSDRFSTHL